MTICIRDDDKSLSFAGEFSLNDRDSARELVDLLIRSRAVNNGGSHEFDK